MQMEKDGEAYYRDLAEKTSDAGVRTILLAMADEERRHWQILDNMIEMVNAPERWVENAEWRNPDMM